MKLCVAALVMALLFGLKLPDHSGLPPGLRPHRPAVVAVVNALGAPLVGTGLVLPSAKALIASACRAAQLPPGTCSSLYIGVTYRAIATNLPVPVCRLE